MKKEKPIKRRQAKANDKQSCLFQEAKITT